MPRVGLEENRVDLRGPLFADADARRALDLAEAVFARAWRSIDEHGTHAPESVGAYAGCLLVAHALASADRPLPVALREIATKALVTSPDRRGLYDGRAGLLAVLDAIAPDDAAFARPRAALRAAVADDLLATGELDPQQRPAYDLISGAAGKLIALRAVPDAVADHVRMLFAAFADRVEERLDDPDPERSRVDIGVAHGVPGVLAALNVALPGEHALGRRYADLVVALSHVTDGVRRWDGRWSRDAVPPPRRAWCYQTVGVAAVLHDRALIDGDDALRALAVDALAATLHEPEQANWDDALCHGRSGVALLYAHAAANEARFAGSGAGNAERADGGERLDDAGRFEREARRLALDVLRKYRDDAPFGYPTYNLVRHVAEHRAEFLDAALGVALFLIEAAAPSPRRWLPLLGLLPETAA